MDRASLVTPGGAFLAGPTAPACAATPEDLPADARLMGDAMEAFVRTEVLPRQADLEAREPGLLRDLLRKAGGLGLLAGAVPTEYGGLGLCRTTLVRLYERAALRPSFALAHNVHSGVATLPLVWFGTPEQKAAYLPRMAAGECVGAFALTEGNSGSDALSARCVARPVAGGGWRLSGTKNWITNAGVADLFVVFARIEGDRGVSAFLVPRDAPGLSVGREEEKLGLRGASTCALFLDDVPVGADALLGEPGAGHRVALFPLNVGRLNIAAGALGAAKESLRGASAYARSRRQFGRPLSEFGLIQSKLGEMAARLFAAEAMVYRVAGLLDAAVQSGLSPIQAAEEYAVECALVKIYATEAQGYVVDEALQIHGGYGFAENYPAARAYRDARVTRIFEGTNEINRLTVADQLARRVRAGRLAFDTPPADGDPLTDLRAITVGAWQSLWERFPDGATQTEQETAAACADLTLSLFAAESARLRAARMAGTAGCEFAKDAADVVLLSACETARTPLRAVCARLGDRGLWDRLAARLPELWVDGVVIRRRVAERE